MRTTLQTLREPRYAALSALMLLVALICVAAGTWQIARFDNKVHDNDKLTGNAHAAGVPVDELLPVVGGRGPSADAIRYRTAGAVEPQHFAYLIQWYLFAVLALAAPLAMSRAERREQAASDGHGPDVAPTQDELRVAKLADRYGRPVHR